MPWLNGVQQSLGKDRKSILENFGRWSLKKPLVSPDEKRKLHISNSSCSQLVIAVEFLKLEMSFQWLQSPWIDRDPLSGRAELRRAEELCGAQVLLRVEDSNCLTRNKSLE